MSTDSLFVYGTLRAGSANPFARLLAETATLRGPARTRARLFLIADYPGAIPSSEDGEFVFGELWALHDSANTLAALDDYEGGEFTRAVAEVLTESGEAVAAWIYWYNGTLTGLERIESGRMRN